MEVNAPSTLKAGEVLEMLGLGWAKDEHGQLWALVPESQLDRLTAVHTALGQVLSIIPPPPPPQLPQKTQPNRVKEGQHLRKVRENHAITLQVLAHRAGITADHLNNLEKGKTEIGRDSIVALSKALILDARVLAQAIGEGGTDRWGFEK